MSTSVVERLLRALPQGGRTLFNNPCTSEHPTFDCGLLKHQSFTTRAGHVTSQRARLQACAGGPGSGAILISPRRSIPRGRGRRPSSLLAHRRRLEPQSRDHRDHGAGRQGESADPEHQQRQVRHVEGRPANLRQRFPALRPSSASRRARRSRTRMIMPTRPGSTYRVTRASAGSMTTSTRSCPISMPTLKANSDTSRCEPANCRSS